MLDKGESSEGLQCYFYLFSVPEAWKRFLGFNKLVPTDLVPEPYQGKDCCVLVFTGFLNSVGIAQHIHRNVVHRAAGISDGLLGGERELRKDLGFPMRDVLPGQFRWYQESGSEVGHAD